MKVNVRSRVSDMQHKLPASLIMAAVCNRAGHYIFILSFLLSFFFFFLCFPRLIAAVADRTGLKRAARGSLKIQDAKNRQKNPQLGTIAQLCRAISSQLRHLSTSEKKLVKQQYLLRMS